MNRVIKDIAADIKALKELVHQFSKDDASGIDILRVRIYIRKTCFFLSYGQQQQGCC
jgi:hypothetical protein